MFKNYLLVLLISAFMPFEMMAEWVSVDKNNASPTPPKVTILSDDNSGTVIKIEIPGFNINDLTAGDKAYQSLDLLDEILTSESGFPQLPYIAKVLAIPDQEGISIEVLETGEIQTFENIYLPPARESWFEGNTGTPLHRKCRAYQSEDIYPNDFAEI